MNVPFTATYPLYDQPNLYCNNPRVSYPCMTQVAHEYLRTCLKSEHSIPVIFVLNCYYVLIVLVGILFLLVPIMACKCSDAIM